MLSNLEKKILTYITTINLCNSVYNLIIVGIKMLATKYGIGVRTATSERTAVVVNKRIATAGRRFHSVAGLIGGPLLSNRPT